MIFTNILQDKNICFIFIRVTLFYMQKALETQVFMYGLLYSPILMWMSLYCYCIQYRVEFINMLEWQIT